MSSRACLYNYLELLTSHFDTVAQFFGRTLGHRGPGNRCWSRLAIKLQASSFQAPSTVKIQLMCPNLPTGVVSIRDGDRQSHVHDRPCRCARALRTHAVCALRLRLLAIRA
jgi:hypothetical protein